MNDAPEQTDLDPADPDGGPGTVEADPNSPIPGTVEQTTGPITADDVTEHPETGGLRVRVLAEGRRVFAALRRWPHDHGVEAEEGDVLDVHPEQAGIVADHVNAGLVELAPDAELTEFPKPEPVTEDEQSPEDLEATRAKVDEALGHEDQAAKDAEAQHLTETLAAAPPAHAAPEGQDEHTDDLSPAE